MTEFLRMSGMYWGLTALDLMGQDLGKEEVIEFITQCQYPNGGFSASAGHDPHLLYTLSAVQVSSQRSTKYTPFVCTQCCTDKLLAFDITGNP